MLKIGSGALDWSAAEVVQPTMAHMSGSVILDIAREVRELRAQGCEICNLTMGDFLPKHFPVPETLAESVAKAYRDGNTNYPPSSGVPELCEAVASIYRDFFGLDYGAEGVVIGSGARPPLYATWALFTQPGDHTVSFLPSWNSRYYKHLMQTNHQFIATNQANNFHPTVEQILQVLPTVQLISMNSPLNPTGTVIDSTVLKQIAESIVEENRRRKSQQRRPVMWLYDQVYWMLLEEGYQHVSPVQLCPEVAPYVVHIDAASKCFAATGLRVGWGVLPPYLQPKMRGIIGHMGAWAAKPEQLAIAHFLNDRAALSTYMTQMRQRISDRLNLLYQGIMQLRQRGLPVDAIEPQGAIYLSFRLDIVGEGRPFTRNEELRQWLLHNAGLAVVPFQAFDLEDESGWFRMSIGASGLPELHSAMERLERALLRVAVG